MYKVILISCLAAACSAGLLGGYKDITNEDDANVPAVLAFAESELNKRMNSIYKSKITDVNQILRQLVNGFNYEINFKIESTECNQYSDKELTSCMTTGRVQNCKAKVYTSFNGETMEMTDFGCKGQSKRDMEVGGWKEADPSSYKDYAFRALQMKNSLMDASTVEVVRARVQTVAGQNIDLTIRGVENGETKLCDINIWTQPWLKGDDSFKVMNFDCTEELLMSRRDMKVGGWKNADPSSFKDVAFRALQMKNSLMDTSTVEVVRARVQTVAGQNIDLTIRGVENGETKICDINIWTQPWKKGDDSFKVMKFDCAKEEKMNTRAGGWRDANPSSYKDYAFRALQMKNSLMDASTVEVVKARVQIVAGENIDLTVRGVENGEAKLCDINIWTQPWKKGDDSFKVMKFDCAKEESKSVRGLAGGWSDADPNEYKIYAFRALQKQNSLMDPDTVEVVKAKVQVVSGLNVMLTIRGKENGKSTLCDINVWSQPWLKGEDNFKVTRYNCADEKKTREVEGCAGCVSNELPNPEDYRPELLEAVANENLLLDEQNTKILSVKTQVVAGTKYIMKIQTTKDGKI